MAQKKHEMTVSEMTSKGGKARAKKLTAEQRRAIAKKGAAARWKKKRKFSGGDV